MIVPVLVFVAMFYVTWTNLYKRGEFLITLFNSTFVGIVFVAMIMSGQPDNCTP